MSDSSSHLSLPVMVRRLSRLLFGQQDIPPIDPEVLARRKREWLGLETPAKPSEPESPPPVTEKATVKIEPPPTEPRPAVAVTTPIAANPAPAPREAEAPLESLLERMRNAAVAAAEEAKQAIAEDSIIKAPGNEQGGEEPAGQPACEAAAAPVGSEPEPPPASKKPPVRAAEGKPEERRATGTETRSPVQAPALTRPDPRQGSHRPSGRASAADRWRGSALRMIEEEPAPIAPAQSTSDWVASVLRMIEAPPAEEGKTVADSRDQDWEVALRILKGPSDSSPAERS